MSSINKARLIVGGLAAGVVMNAVTLLSARLYLSEMMQLLESRGIQPPDGLIPMAVYLLMRFVWGFVAVWFYVVARPYLALVPEQRSSWASCSGWAVYSSPS